MLARKPQASRATAVATKFPARPDKAKRPVDFKALRQEAIKRYPKIISELAK